MKRIEYFYFYSKINEHDQDILHHYHYQQATDSQNASESVKQKNTFLGFQLKI